MYGQPRQSLYPGASTSGAPPLPSGAAPNSTVTISTQLMQLDQEITSTLQEIDQNFTTAHQIVTSRILPAIKRYGIASARTLDGAKFWKVFFETSANVSLSSRRQDEDDEDVNASYEQSTTHDAGSEGHTTFTSDDIDASPRSQADAQLYDQDVQNQSILQSTAVRSQRGNQGAEQIGDDSGEGNTFYSTLDRAKASSPPRFSNASMAAAARREADKRAQQEQRRRAGEPAGYTSVDPSESPFERLRRDLTQDLGRADDSTMEDSIAQAHQKQKDLAAARNRGDTGKVYYDDVTNDQTIEVDRSTLARDVEKLDISQSRQLDPDASASSPIAPPPRLSKAIGSSSPVKKRAAGTPRARGPLLHKVLNSEQRKRDAATSGRKGRDSLPRIQVTPRSAASSQNPFTQPASVKMWNGIVDLRKTPLNTKTQKPAKGRAGNSRRKNEAGETASEWDSGEENDSFGWPEGMSPPVTMQFSVPQSKYAKTPAKEAARLMVEDLLKSVGGSRATGQALSRPAPVAAAAAAPAPQQRDPLGSAGQSNPGPRRGAPVPGSSRGSALVGTPLSRTKREAREIERAAAVAGLHRRRDSMPTPPTVTKKGPSLSAAAHGKPRMSTTPEVTPQAGSFANTSSSLLRRGPAAGDGSGGANSAAAMLMDEDEGLESRRLRPSNVYEDDEDEDEEVPQNLGTKLSAVALQSQQGGAAAVGGIMHLPDEDDEDDDEDDDSDSLDSDDDDDDQIPPPSSVASSAAKYSNSSQPRDQSGTGWTSSTVSSSSRVGGGGRSIEDDTLFGVPKPASARNEDTALRNPFSYLGNAPRNPPAAAPTGPEGPEQQKEFVVWGQVDEMGTVHGGRPLIDRDDTYSAPSPTPMHFGQPPRP